MKILNLQFANINPPKTTKNNSVGGTPLYLNVLSRDTVSFGQKSDVVQPPVITPQSIQLHGNLRELKEIKNLPCVYCGEPMLTVPERTKIVAQMVGSSGDDLIITLKRNRKYLRGIKVNIANSIMKAAKKNPDDKLDELLKKLAAGYKSELEAEQLAILRNLSAIIEKHKVSDKEKAIFQQLLYDTNQWINNEKDSEPFKRKAFLYELKQILDLPLFRNRSLVKKLMHEAEKMPQSFESENAFIVKYHRRSPREIAEQLFYEPLATIEHIKTRESGGKTEPKNLAIACARCNNYVRNNTPMPKFVKEHPEINNNIRKNLDAVLKIGRNINKVKQREEKRLKETKNPQYLKYLQSLEASSVAYENYVKAVSQTFINESGGKLKLEQYL